MDDGDWDLNAVVRGCTAAPKNTGATTAPTITDPFPDFTSMPFHQSSFDDFTGGDKNTNPFQGLEDVYQELCGDYPPPSATGGGGVMPSAATQAFQFPDQGTTTVHDQIVNNNAAYQVMNMQQGNIHHEFNKNQAGYGGFVSHTNPQPVRPRRRKTQQLKMVRQMTQEELTADSWAWRKYGQKPIKGSPYPRNYYRCSTSKGCTARKQVERSPGDPVIFTVSYTGEHTHPKPSHRSSLAGSTRNKTETKPTNNNMQHQKGAGTWIVSSSSSFSPCQPVMVEGESVKENEDLENLDITEELDQDEDDDDNGLGMIPANEDDFDLFKGFEASDDHDDLGGGGDHSFSGGDWY